jgi:hypothetical protein
LWCACGLRAEQLGRGPRAAGGQLAGGSLAVVCWARPREGLGGGACARGRRGGRGVSWGGAGPTRGAKAEHGRRAGSWRVGRVGAWAVGAAREGVALAQGGCSGLVCWCSCELGRGERWHLVEPVAAGAGEVWAGSVDGGGLADAARCAASWADRSEAKQRRGAATRRAFTITGRL